MTWDGIDRRKSDSLWVRMLRFLSLLGWVIFTVSLVLSFYAAPEQSYGLTRYYDIQVRDTWLSPLTDYLYVLLWGTAVFSLVSIFISHFRVRRSTDDKYYNFWLLLIVCTSWAVYIAIKT